MFIDGWLSLFMMVVLRYVVGRVWNEVCGWECELDLVSRCIEVYRGVTACLC